MKKFDNDLKYGSSFFSYRLSTVVDALRSTNGLSRKEAWPTAATLRRKFPNIFNDPSGWFVPILRTYSVKFFVLFEREGDEKNGDQFSVSLY